MNYNDVLDIGKRRRLSRIFNSKEKCIIVPLDDNLISGTITGITNIKTKLNQIETAKPNAILAFSGTLSIIQDYSIPIILNVTASTINSCHTNKVIVSSVEKAVKLGADAVAVHINLTSKYESKMIENIAKISKDCDKFGMPLLAIVYPRGEKIDSSGNIKDENYLQLRESNPEDYTKLVSHCVRLAFELGADIIKTQYTGTIESFKKVIESAGGKPVVIAGGNKVDVRTIFEMTENAIKAGASGVSIGRNVFNRKDSDKIISCLQKLVFDNLSAKDVLNIYNQGDD